MNILNEKKIVVDKILKPIEQENKQVKDNVLFVYKWNSESNLKTD